MKALPSTGITRLRQYYDLLRLPPRQPCLPWHWDSSPQARRISPDYPHHLSNVPCLLPRWTETGAHVGCFPIRLGLPRTAVGSASTSSLSRPAQASRALRPAGSLSRPMATFVTRLRSGQLPSRTARQLPDQPTILWVEPPSTGVTRLRGALLSKKGFWRGRPATLIQDQERARNLDSKNHQLGFFCFNF